MKKNRTMIAIFMAPAVLMFCIIYLYPVIRTLIMSFFRVEGVTDSMNLWQFNGVGNYTKLFTTTIYRTAMLNAGKLWLIGGIFVLIIALLFAVILTSGVRFKSFFRAAIYLPNVVSAVALATMWIYYVFDRDFGFFKDFFTFLHIDSLAKLDWLSSDMKFWSMMIAFCFGSVGYFMLIFLSGIERIPEDLYEAATIDGANKIKQFTKVTLPLLKGVIKTNITFWSVSIVSFFVWSMMFSPVDSESSTITPVVYMYNTVFGSRGNAVRDAGRGAAIGIMLAICIIFIFNVVSRLLRDDDLEF